MTLLDKPIGELAATIPNAQPFFRANGLDFCCHGQQTLAAILKYSNIDQASFLAQLISLTQQQQTNQATQCSVMSSTDLIAHLIDNFHEKHRQQFPELIRLTQKVASRHAEHPDFPHALEAHLSQMQFELEQHMMKEEEILFPMILRGMYPSGPIAVMESEHVEHARALEKLSSLTYNFTPPTGACSSWQALYKGVEQLYQDLREHIHIENDILFTRAN